VGRGALQLVLQQFEARPMPLSLVYASRRNQSTRVRVVMDWLARVVTEHCARDAG
jgi:DNA-binding transcriptional LysR family regulator